MSPEFRRYRSSRMASYSGQRFYRIAFFLLASGALLGPFPFAPPSPPGSSSSARFRFLQPPSSLRTVSTTNSRLLGQPPGPLSVRSTSRLDERSPPRKIASPAVGSSTPTPRTTHAQRSPSAQRARFLQTLKSDFQRVLCTLCERCRPFSGPVA